ncbi:DUF6457 domain-containing protein [Arthrobacter sp. 35W]|uniref:DUF6457 domain-containing protein n=1 Tax=Arthrobacter sp. 35W TaxID=1132441 RepID=UPI000412A185|nr:DUF6457 domain-containing protein [Arthrobacter sp. 35W]
MKSQEEVLSDWLHTLVQAFEIADVDVDIDAILSLAGVAAHNVIRPAAPLTTFVAGLAAGLAAGSGQASEELAITSAIAMARRLAEAEAGAQS